ncbi:hypothetical protein K469DRAFT_710852 [Zopfia rhizophila CBS 207.26]|uniref:Fungal N-terminal domain-containing protein n=1 Tax=Zopfia rhizophila CBS 207.26 TaxID=1314779 RepID=A0A6A6DYQ5_9PEZI|nr:hypothetical protein K469DRAFT_710852 [Zopfia rhizophila CBS 207.26]
MSDPLSVTACILTLATTGFVVAKGLYQLANGIGSAGEEVRAYAEEIDSFSKLLQRIKAELQEGSNGASQYEQNLLLDIVGVCERVLGPLHRIQKILNPLLERFRDSPRKLRQFRLRVQWTFSSRAKLLFYRKALKGQHRLLDTMLELVILQATKDKSPQNM